MESELSVPSPRARVCVQNEKQSRDFLYKFRSKGATYQLKVPLELPYIGNPRELAVRLVNTHKLPCYLEDDLCGQLKQFALEETVKLLDQVCYEHWRYAMNIDEGVGVRRAHNLITPPVVLLHTVNNRGLGCYFI